MGGVQWLVDPHDVNKLVPIGAEGEVMLESYEMSTGYLNDAAKTAHAFVESPTWANKRNVAAGCRYLRLGDLARYESDGSITVLGRADTQVKVCPSPSRKHINLLMTTIDTRTPGRASRH